MYGSVDGDDARARQQRRRVAEARAVIDSIDEIARQLPAGVAVDKSRLSLIGHSFGGSSVLRTAADIASGRPRGSAGLVRAVVACDPWISGYDETADGVAPVPTLALLTPSMMYPGNERKVGGVMRRLAQSSATALYAEVRDTRHQEISDFPCINHSPLRFFCMAGARPPAEAHALQTSLVAGFLALAGALDAPAGSELAAQREVARGLFLAAEEPPPEESDYIVHGASLGAAAPPVPASPMALSAPGGLAA